MACSMPSFPVITNSQSLLKLMSIESVMPSNHLILCHPLLFLPSIFPSIRVFSNESFFQSGGQIIGVLASASILPINIQDWLVWSPCSPRDSKELTPTLQFKSISSLVLSFLYSPTLTSMYDYWKKKALTRQKFVSKVMSLPFNILSLLVITFLPGSKHLLISWLQSPSAVILEPKKIKSVTVSIVSPSICHEVMGLEPMILVFWILSFKPAFSLSSFTFIKSLFSSSSLSGIRVVSSAYLRLLTFLLAILIPAYASSSLGCHMMYFACKLNKQVTIYILDKLLSQSEFRISRGKIFQWGYKWFKLQ